MSKVFIRSRSDLWIPISAESGAVPNQVNAQTLGGVWKSIGGLVDPTVQKRRIRNAANNGWIDLDQFSTVNPPVQIGNVRYQATSGTQAAIRPDAGAQAGDLLIGFIHSSYSTCTFVSGTATVLTQDSGLNLNLCIAWAVHDGVSSGYTVGLSASSTFEVMGVTVRGAGAAPACLAPSLYRYVGAATSVRDHPTVQNAGRSYLSYFHVVDLQTGGRPYSNGDPFWNVIYSNYGTASNYDQMLASVSDTVVGPVPLPTINAQASGTRWKGIKLVVEA
jgi:hypothetical protein